MPPASSVPRREVRLSPSPSSSSRRPRLGTALCEGLEAKEVADLVQRFYERPRLTLSLLTKACSENRRRRNRGAPFSPGSRARTTDARQSKPDSSRAGAPEFPLLLISDPLHEFALT